MFFFNGWDGRVIEFRFDAAQIEEEDIAWFSVNNSKPCRINNHCLLINLRMNMLLEI